MFKFKDPRLQSGVGQLHDTHQKRNEITLKNGDQINSVSDVDSILSSDDNIADDDGISAPNDDMDISDTGETSGEKSKKTFGIRIASFAN